MSQPNQSSFLELLLFRLHGDQLYGINVFKVQEVLPCPTLTQMPEAHASVRGMANLRGRTVPIFDLSSSISLAPIAAEGSYVIVTEFSRSMHGMLVRSVDKIVRVAWDKVLPPPTGVGKGSYLTAVTEIEGRLVEIIDVERVLDQVSGVSTEVSGELRDQGGCLAQGRRVIVVDDSTVARHQIRQAMEQIGVECDMYQDGRQALDALEARVEQDAAAMDDYLMLVSDIEMPEMNGYALTQKLRQDSRLSQLYVLLHSSISGRFNEQMVSDSGADQFIPKYNPDDLAAAVMKRCQQLGGAGV